MNNDVKNFDELQQYVLNTLTEKWQDHFSPVSYSGKQLMQNHYHFVVKSEKYQQTVNVDVDDHNKELLISDNYATLSFNEEACGFLAMIALETLNGCSVLCTLYPDQRMNNCRNFAEYVQLGQCGLNAYFISKVAIEPSQRERIAEKIFQQGIFGRLSFVQISESVGFSELTVKDMNTNNPMIISMETVSLNNPNRGTTLKGEENGTK